MYKILLLVVLGLVLTSACGTSSISSNVDDNATPASVPADYKGKTNPLGEGAATEGANVFKTNCEMCHGSQGHGDGPAGLALDPRPRNLAVLQKTVGDDYLFWRISEGKPGTSMVAWKGILTEEQIWQIISFVRTLQE